MKQVDSVNNFLIRYENNCTGVAGDWELANNQSDRSIRIGFSGKQTLTKDQTSHTEGDKFIDTHSQRETQRHRVRYTNRDRESHTDIIKDPTTPNTLQTGEMGDLRNSFAHGSQPRVTNQNTCEIRAWFCNKGVNKKGGLKSLECQN